MLPKVNSKRGERRRTQLDQSCNPSKTSMLHGHRRSKVMVAQVHKVSKNIACLCDAIVPDCMGFQESLYRKVLISDLFAVPRRKRSRPTRIAFPHNPSPLRPQLGQSSAMAQGTLLAKSSVMDSSEKPHRRHRSYPTHKKRQFCSSVIQARVRLARRARTKSRMRMMIWQTTGMTKKTRVWRWR
jgi:hypothetical protein